MTDRDWPRITAEAVTAGVLTVAVFLLATTVVETDDVWVLGVVSMILGYSLAHSFWEFI